MVWLESRTNRVQKVIPVKHRAPYSCVDVKSVSVESVAERRRGQALVVGKVKGVGSL